MVSNPQVRSKSLRNYTLGINKLRKKENKKCLSIEKVAKQLIEENGDELKKKLIKV